MANRKKATELLLNTIEEIAPKSGNKEYYEQLLKGMSDKAFGDFMKKLRDEEMILSLTIPNLSEHRLNSQRNIKIAKKLGHDFMQRLWLTDPQTNQVYKTNLPYLVLDVPIRRQQELLVKKISVPKDNSKVDQYSGQPVKGAKISYPELQALYAQGLDYALTELIKFRGGDEEAFRMMNRVIIDQGQVRLSQLPQTSGVKSTKTLGIYLKGMHYDNNL